MLNFIISIQGREQSDNDVRVIIAGHGREERARARLKRHDQF